MLCIIATITTITITPAADALAPLCARAPSPANVNMANRISIIYTNIIYTYTYIYIYVYIYIYIYIYITNKYIYIYIMQLL